MYTIYGYKLSNYIKIILCTFTKESNNQCSKLLLHLLSYLLKLIEQKVVSDKLKR